MRRKITLLFFVFVFSSLSLKHDKKEESVIDKIICNYYEINKDNYIEKFNYFRISKYVFEEECLILYRISPELNNIYLPRLKNNLYDVYPTNYKVVNGNYFFWRNNSKEIPKKKILTLLDSLGFIDSSFIKYELGLLNEDSIKHPLIVKDDGIRTENYIICKKDTTKIKRRFSVPSYYSITKLAQKARCKCN